MKRCALMISLMVVLGGGVLSAQTITIDLAGAPITITVTARARASLNAELVRVNVDRLPDPPWTLTEWFQDVIDRQIRGFVQSDRVADRDLACGERWAAVSAADKTNVSAIFGGVSPCLAR